MYYRVKYLRVYKKKKKFLIKTSFEIQIEIKI